MALTFETPIGSDFLKNFPAQNEVNCDRIDNYVGPQAPRLAPIGTYVPILSATVTPPTLGAGTIGGFYYRIFDLVYSWGFFRFGTGFSAGSGVYTVTLPFAAKNLVIPPNTALGRGAIVGNGFVWDDSAIASRQPVTAQLRTDTTMHFGLRANSGAGAREVTGIAPITWAVDDGIKWAARFQRST